MSAWVRQQSYAEADSNAFGHVLYLDTDWHLRKKLGSTMRMVDRGLNGAERLMSYIAAWGFPRQVGDSDGRPGNASRGRNYDLLEG